MNRRGLKKVSAGILVSGDYLPVTGGTVTTLVVSSGLTVSGASSTIKALTVASGLTVSGAGTIKSITVASGLTVSGSITGKFQYAAINATGSAAISVTGAGVFYQVPFTSDGPENTVSGDSSNDHITVKANGDYLVTYSMTGSHGVSDLVEYEVRKNNGGTRYQQTQNTRVAATGQAVGTVAGNGILNLTANDTVELWVANITDTTNITIREGALTVLRLA